MGKQVFFKGKLVFTNLSLDTINKMIAKRWVVLKENKYEFIENNEHKHLFNEKIAFGKRLDYFKRLNEKGCKCEDCDKELSLHIRPFIEADGQVNFKKIVCVCKECRTKKLEKQDILVPQFKKTFTTGVLNKEITEELHKRFTGRALNILLTDKEYLRMKRNEKKLYSLTKISLPPLPKKSRNLNEERAMLRTVGLQSMQQDLDLERKDIRVSIRKFLSNESSSKCPCCGHRTEYVEYTIDHIQPKSKGGPNTMENFIGMCKECNKDKGDYTVLEYLQRKHFKALPERVLKVAYAEQKRIKEEYEVFKLEVQTYENERLRKFAAI